MNERLVRSVDAAIAVPFLWGLIGYAQVTPRVRFPCES